MPDLSNVFGPTCYNIRNTPIWLYASCRSWYDCRATALTIALQLYMWNAAFELTVLILTLSATVSLSDLNMSNVRMRARTLSRVTKQFLTDAGLYFAVSFTVHLTEFAWTFNHQDDHIYAGAMLPVHGMVVFVIGPRVIANLKQTAALGNDSLKPRGASDENPSVRAFNSGNGSINRAAMAAIQLQPQGLVSSTNICLDNPPMRPPTHYSFSESSSCMRSIEKGHYAIPADSGRGSNNFQRRTVTPRDIDSNFSFPLPQPQEPAAFPLDKHPCTPSV